MNSELQQAIMEQLKAPVKRKDSNDYMTDEEGNGQRKMAEGEKIF